MSDTRCIMKSRISTTLLVGYLTLPAACTKGAASPRPQPPAESLGTTTASFVANSSATAPAVHRFADHDGDIPPKLDYNGPLFELSQDYPPEPPEPKEQPWLEIDPKRHPARYLESIRDYYFEGMVEVDFKAQDNSIRKWYQVPWMHVGGNPREAIRGLTNERGSRPKDLGPTQTDFQQNWGTGFYNPIGGYTVGQVWADPQRPDPTKAQFLEGAVVVKILFSAAPLAQVPDLEGSPVWKAYIRKDGQGQQGKEVREVRLLQMDVAVKDKRAGTTGWFFGSLVYDKDTAGSDGWHKLAPGGLQWGNDHGYGSAGRQAGKSLKETVMMPTQPRLSTYKTELGWLGRLNGPVDNPASSCMSCHSTAQWKNVVGLLAPTSATESERMNWFRTLPGNEAFSKGQIALDFSLQLQLSMQNFYDPTLNTAVVDKSAIEGCKTTAREEGRLGDTMK